MFVELYAVCPHLLVWAGSKRRLRQDMRWNVTSAPVPRDTLDFSVPCVIVCDACADDIRDGRGLDEVGAIVGPGALRRFWWARLLDRIFP